TSRLASLDRSGEETMTADIGTSTYVAPEVTAKASGATRYNQKVDMYSLGIIFFEMCYPMSTGMERATVLHNLRSPEIAFPADFPVERMALQHQIIRRLLSHNPRQRPSSAELLESDMLPPRMEDEYLRETIRTIANPSQPYFPKLMDSLFAHVPSKHIDATFDFRAGDMPADQLNAVFLDRIRELMTKVFRAHAAVELSTPALTPRADLLDMHQRAAHYVDPRGTVVQLPFDQKEPFARYVARSRMTEIKRYCFDRVFRANPTGGQPLARNAVSFDAVTNRSAHAVAAAEVVAVACEVFRELPAFRTAPLVLLLNHMAVLDAILAFCGILHPAWATPDRSGFDAADSADDSDRHVQFVRNVCHAIGGVGREKPQAVRQRIQIMCMATGVQLQAPMLDRLQAFMLIRGDLNHVQREVLGRLGSECGMAGTRFAARGAEYVRRAVSAFNELRYVEATVRHFGVSVPVAYVPLFSHSYAYYEGAYCFQLVSERRSKSPQVLAVGGRCDGLLRRFGHLAGEYAPVQKSAETETAPISPEPAPPPPLLAEGRHDLSSFAHRTGAKHSRDVWRQMYASTAGDVAIGTNLSAGSAVLGTARDVVCLGVQIDLDLVVQEMARYQQQILQTAETATFGLWTRKRCDVVVASFGTIPLLKERISLARELWANDLRTDFLFNDDPEMSMERLVEICRDQGMNWIVTLKKKSGAKRRSDAADKFVYKVKNILRRVESEVARDCLVEWLQTDINEQFKLDMQIHGAKSMAKQQEQRFLPDTSALAAAAAAAASSPMPVRANSQQILDLQTPGRLDITVVSPHMSSSKGLSRTKHKQRMLLLDRATANVSRIIAEVAKNSPVLVLELGDEFLRRLMGEPSILTEAGHRRILELCSAHQRSHVVELRSQLERFKREGFTYVWLYANKSETAVNYKL
ncbi:eukaryotic translation initiation factor 2-alpha kinase, partial [Linderina macrospora]